MSKYLGIPTENWNLVLKTKNSRSKKVQPKLKKKKLAIGSTTKFR